MALPKNNLSTLSQPWAREVEKLIVNTQSTLSKNEINNVARDAQLAASYRRLDTAVTSAATAAAEANAAILGLTSLGSVDSEYTINAGNINAGTLTGVTLQTGTSGSRVVINEADISFYGNGATGTYSGQILGATSGAALNLTSGNGDVWVSDDGFLAGHTYFDGLTNHYTDFYVNAVDGVTIQGSSAMGLYVDTKATFNGLAYFNQNVQVAVGKKLTVGSTFEVGSVTTLKDDVYYESRPASSVIGTPIHVRTSGASTNLLFDYTSSRRYKSDIIDLEIDYDKFTSVPVRSFVYKGDETEYGPNAQRGYGYIAEELDEAGFTDLVIYREKEGGGTEPYSLAFYSINAVTQVIVNKQAKMIKELQERVALLEAK